MGNPGSGTLFFMLVMLGAIWLRWRDRRERHVNLPAAKFWKLVRSREKPVVLFTTRGWLIKRLCYVLPYQGILFMTDARDSEAPDGVTIIGTGESFSLS